jgi:biopolymer transport protein ExbD
MSIEVSCLECGASHHVNDRLAGRSVRCPGCDAVVAVPEKSTVREFEPNANAGNATVQGEPEIVAAELIPSETVVLKSETGNVALRQTANETPAAVISNPVDDDEDEIDEVLIRKKRPEEEMDMTPMVDVTFLLLIFFMVTAAFSLQKSIRMPRQQTDLPSVNQVEEEDDELDSVEVEVDEFGGFLVIAQDWERETPGKQNLITALKEAISASKDGMRLVVKVHEMAKLHSLVDAMDAGTIAGFAELEVTQVEEFN